MRVLHAGAGWSHVPEQYFEQYEEVTLDIDQRCKPDILTSIVDMGSVPDDCFEALYTSHTLEHVAPHEVRQCLWNFLRVIKPGGIAMVTVPNLENVKATGDVVYQSPIGPICGLDMIYGHHDLVRDNPYMAHKCGFVEETLRAAMESVGFEDLHVVADSCYNLTAIGRKPAPVGAVPIHVGAVPMQPRELLETA